MLERLRAYAGRSLEVGARPSRIGLTASATWSALASRRVARPITLPSGLAVIGVGSAVLGGAGKTPVALALARELARSGARVSLIGHAYRATPSHPREVSPLDRIEVVGDDALASARLLAGSGVSVIVAQGREAALAYACAHGAEIAVADGLLQATPARIACSILVLDELSPWGSGRCPPLGDLRAPKEALLTSTDYVVGLMDVVGDAADRRPLPRGALRLASSLEGAVDTAGASHELASLRTLRVGLLLAIAHPERILRALARRGIEPGAVVTLADHASFVSLSQRLPPGVRADVWLTTARCATKLPVEVRGAPVLALDHRIDASPLVGALLESGRVNLPSAARMHGALC